jgi:type I restriction enzyme S subunit
MSNASLGVRCLLGDLAPGDLMQVGPFGSQLHASDYTPEGVAVIMPSDLRDGRLEACNAARVSTDTTSALEKHILKEGDLVFARRGDIGRVALVRTADLPALCGTGCIRVRLDGNACAAVVLQACRSPSAQRWLKANAVGQTMLNLNGDILSRLPLAIPPLARHSAIEQFLLRSEECGERLGALVAAKQKMRRALGNELLCGRRRVPGYGPHVSVAGSLPSGWRDYSLAEVADIHFSSVDKKTLDGESSVRLCNYMDVWKHDYIDDDMPFMVASASGHEIERFRLRVGDVVLTKDSETRADIASTAVVRSVGDDVVLGYHLALIRPKPDLAVGSFIAKQLMLPLFRTHFVRAATGATRYGLSLDAVRRARVWLPHVSEQAAVARIIEMCDAELALLVHKVGRLKDFHIGIMEGILAGSGVSGLASTTIDEGSSP